MVTADPTAYIIDRCPRLERISLPHRSSREGHRCIERWLSQNKFASVAEMRGYRDGMHVDNAGTFLRTQYLRALSDYALHHPPAVHARDLSARDRAPGR
jgi:hypothetical protein